ncbi:Beta-lactamase domain-containing protein [Mycena indigotica]|uniref:Beta-lactamase domain-containing protein n=1 Tax=Mycena indigotica TaxID=2126181 RepID=A0A8H6SE89_9AGAR|nr:Beta-lactamase domain-containing protein [Mycena indigotica]KAF7297131.1 Beta-lactamase domain-containing protein [Mycena indigotica]
MRPRKFDPILSSDIDTFVHNILTAWNSPAGIALAIVREDGRGGWFVEKKGYGNATADGKPVTTDTLFGIGSESKLFDVLATGLLVSNKSLATPISWTSKVADIIPGWSLMDTVSSSASTLIDLMSHRTGLPRHDGMLSRNDTLPTIISRLKYLKPSTGFRETLQYNNLMYAVLSYLPTVLLPSKPSLAKYVKENIFDQLGMKSSTYSFTWANATGKMADSFAREANATTNPLLPGRTHPIPFWLQLGGDQGNFASGPGGVISNLDDLVLWLKMLMSDGVNPDTNMTVIPKDVLTTITTGVTVWPSEEFPELSPSTYGGGRYRSNYRGHDLIEHGGDIQGWHSMITWFPNDGAGMIILSNDDLVYTREVIRYRVLDALFSLEPVDWNARYQQIATGTAAARAAFVSTSRPPNAAPPTVPGGLEAMPGTYSNPGYTSLELCLITPTPKLQSDPCKALATTLSSTYPQFVADPRVPTLAFTWDRLAAQYVTLSHFNGDIFNLTGWTGMPTDPRNLSSPLWALDARFAGTIALSGTDKNGIHGFGFIGGIWGAGVGVHDPIGQTPEDRSEVWFTKTENTSVQSLAQNVVSEPSMTSGPTSGEENHGVVIVGLLAGNLVVLTVIAALAVLNYVRTRTVKYRRVKSQEI